MGRTVGYSGETRKMDCGKWDENATMVERRRGVTRKTRPGTKTSERQWERRRLPRRSPKEDWTGRGIMMRGEEHILGRFFVDCWERIYQGKGREDDRQQDGKTRANETWKVLGWERARRRTGRCGEGRSSVIPATLHDGKSQRKRLGSMYGTGSEALPLRSLRLPPLAGVHQG